MDREHVSSSNLHSVGYDEETETLEIEFHNGRIYRYSSVPADVHERLMSAASKGTYFNEHIKERYRCRRVR
jgi:hypothetical protein